MVWCARESLDYASSQAMVCHWHYGWIHWDPPTQSWHSVTNVQLSMPRPPTAEQPPGRRASGEGAHGYTSHQSGGPLPQIFLPRIVGASDLDISSLTEEIK